jgi:hypothetical protein
MVVHDPVWGRAVSVEKTTDPGLTWQKERKLVSDHLARRNGNQDWKEEKIE